MKNELSNVNLPSLLQKLHNDVTAKKKIHLYIKRDDLIHPWVSGNKYRKLKYNIEAALKTNKQPVITFGGAFSNHLYATAGVCYLLDLPCVGIIRGEIDVTNPTLTFCRNMRMELVPVSRTAFRKKEHGDEVSDLLKLHPNAFVIPEGGTNENALRGVAEILDELSYQMEKMPDYIVLACGTGGTTAGLLASDKLTSKVIAFSVLKSYNQQTDIQSLTHDKNADKLEINTQYHFGGYAKWTDQLMNFIHDFELDSLIPLDHVYNGKAMYGLFDLIKSDFFNQGTTICYIHTGGIQGKNGQEYILQKTT